MIQIKAHSISREHREQLTGRREALHAQLAAIEERVAKVKQLEEKAAGFELQIAGLTREAAEGNPEAEIKLAGTRAALKRCRDSQVEIDANGGNVSFGLFRQIDAAQDVVSAAAQSTFKGAIDTAADALASYFQSWEFARQAVVSSPMTNGLFTRCFRHQVLPSSHISSLAAAATDMLAKIDAFLSGGVVFEYHGGEPRVAA